jgi:hypothetical protein
VGRFPTQIFSLEQRPLGLVVALVSAVALGGCGGVEFQGKLFDYAGLSNNGPQEDVKMAERAPLVVPPDRRALPVPGQGNLATARTDWPTDTDREQRRIAAEKEEQARKQEAAADPTNPYAGKPTLLDNILGSKKKTNPDEVVDLPEPDPSDMTAEDRARQQQATTAAGTKPMVNPPQVVGEAPKPAAEDDPFHPKAPDSYNTMSNPSGNSLPQ